jgi:hypothetical protein
LTTPIRTPRCTQHAMPQRRARLARTPRPRRLATRRPAPEPSLDP